MLSRVKKYLSTFHQFDWKTVGNGHAASALLDCLKSRVLDGTNTEQFITLEFYRKSQRERNLFVTNRRTVRLEKRSKDGASDAEIASIRNKALFNEKYRRFSNRAYLATQSASVAEIEAFLKKHGKVLAKPVDSTQGRGIEMIQSDADDAVCAARFAGQNYILEEFLVQHHAMAEINPSSVNTIRLCTVLDDRHTAHVIGDGLRCGGKDSIVDNFHSGGAAYPIDIESGVVCGRGKNNTGNQTFSHHPSTGKQMIGFVIPHWDQVMKAVKEAAEMSERLCYLGWDVAITEDGIEIIEANDGQGCTMWQLDNIGKYREILRYMRQ